MDALINECMLCISDPNIEEVGEQLEKSNYGTPDCCYIHCGEELCYNCTVLPNEKQVPAPSCSGPPTSPMTAESSASVTTASSSVIILFISSLPILNSAYNKIVLHMQLNLNYVIPVDALTFDTVYYCIKRIMKIIPCTRL